MSDVPGGTTVEEEFDPAEITDELEPEPNEPEEGLEGEDEPQEPEEGGEPEPVAETPRQGRKGEAQRYRERAERLERRVEELLTRQPQPAAPQIDPNAAARAEQEKWERRSMMSPVELAQDMDREFRVQQQQVLQFQQYQTNNAIDKLSYDAEARTKKVYQEYQSRVEAMVAEHHARGVMLSRKQALAWIKFEDDEKKAARVMPRQQRAAAARVAGQQTRPAGGRGDVAAGGRRPAAGSLEADIALVNAAISRGESVF